MTPTLLTFAPMIDSECSRLLLAHYRVPYVEAPHIFGWASVLGLKHGFTPQIPQLYGSGPTCVGPRAIVDHYDKACGGRRLIPADGMGAMQANADWDRFNGILAGATAALAYTELLPHRDIMIEPFCRGIPPREAAAAAKYYTALVALFTLLLRLSADTAAAALTQIRVLFEETDRRLADGRRYLQGDRLTLGDIALASAAAPVLLPENSASPIPPFPAMPYTLRAVITEMRQYRTGAFVLRLFAEDFVGGDIRQTPSEP